MPQRRQSILLPALLILLLAVAGGAAFNLLMPQGIGLLPPEVARPLWQEVDTAQAMAMARQGGLIIDAREAGDYKLSRIKGAVNLPPDNFELLYPLYKEKFSQAPRLLVLGRSFSRYPAAAIAQKLISLGHGKVAVWPGGPDEWQTAGGEVISRKQGS